jgi:hypothetical protein
MNQNQEEILQKIINIIGITKENKKIRKEDLCKEETRTQIRQLLDDVKKSYKTYKWRSMKTWKDIEINLITNIFKEHNIDIVKIERKKKIDDKIYRYREYNFLIPEYIFEKK